MLRENYSGANQSLESRAFGHNAIIPALTGTAYTVTNAPKQYYVVGSGDLYVTDLRGNNVEVAYPVTAGQTFEFGCAQIGPLSTASVIPQW